MTGSRRVAGRREVWVWVAGILGDLQILAGGGRIRVAARFNPLDPDRPRGTHIDFTDGRALERQDLFVSALEEFLRQ